MKKIILVFLIIISVTVANLYPKEEGNKPTGKLIDRIIAVVNKRVITKYDLDKLEEQLIKQNASFREVIKDKEKHKELEMQILENIIVSELVSEELKSISREVKDKEIDSEINRILKQNNMTLEQLKSTLLSSEEKNFDEFKNELKITLEKNRLISLVVLPKISIADNDIQNYYNKNYLKKEPDVIVRLRTIFIKYGEKLSKKEKEFKDRLLDSLIERAKRGEEFAKLAKEYSESSSAKEGGDTGHIKLKELAPLFRNAIMGLSVSSVAGPLKTENGFYILKLIEKSHEKIEELEKLKEQIRMKLTEQETEKAFSAWVTEAKKKAFIDIRI